MEIGGRPRRLLGVLAATVLVLAATAAAAQPAPKRGGILKFAVTVEPKDYDCTDNTSFAFLDPVAPQYSTLLKFDAANYPQIIGDLAQSWTVSPDGRTYTFKLRPGVLFHDGTKLTASDVKASYERIIHPPPGLVSARQVDYAAIARIDTPDPLTVVFHLQWPDAAMLANFASPWNCIYSAAKLALDPLYPKTHVLGTGPFVFVEHKHGQYWKAKRWDKYFMPSEPYLDGFEADFIPPGAVMAAYKSGRIMAEFRGVSPPQRDELVKALGNRITVSESPWLSNLIVVFNTKRPPFNDARVRRALSLAIDRWGAAQKLKDTTFLHYVGGLMRPGSNMAIPSSELETLPGFSRDITASRAEARRLLAEAGVHDLKVTLLVRAIPMPHYAGAQLLAESWRAIGVTTTIEKLGIFDWQKKVAAHDFDVAQDFQGDFFDDPTIQLAKYVSQDLSPVDYSGATDRYLDALYIGQALTTDPQERAKIVREFERHALSEAYTVPLLWWDRIVVTAASLKGWTITPSHFIGQDLADVWLDTPLSGARNDNGFGRIAGQRLSDPPGDEGLGARRAR
ncbi:MAG TPA: ABC transporter substrate-binding protein [Stellaceae bacterium]|nr:ABC transporter substrate-binding protein [Stellaceae bacterium]